MERVLKYLNNYFFRIGERGVFAIEDGKIDIENKISVGQYFMIKGSMFNDGVYKVEEIIDDQIVFDAVCNEEFKGVVYLLNIPRTLLSLPQKIDEFETNNKPTNIQSEAFGNYSYSLGTNKNGEIMTWVDVFKNDLKVYKKMYDGIRHVKIVDRKKQDFNAILYDQDKFIEYN